MTSSGALSLIAKGDDEIVITRAFNAPLQMVFDAHTQPELLRRWFGVRNGWEFSVCEVDLKAGGAYCYVWRNEAKGLTLKIRGAFAEITAPSGFVCTESFEEPFQTDEAVNTYSFVESNGQTTLTISTKFPSAADRDMALKSGMETGLHESYVKLDALFA